MRVRFREPLPPPPAEVGTPLAGEERAGLLGLLPKARAVLPLNPGGSRFTVISEYPDIVVIWRDQSDITIRSVFRLAWRRI